VEQEPGRTRASRVRKTDSSEYDVVLYGAGGFTGKQTAAYCSTHAPPGLRWAIAGRNRGKLEAVCHEVGRPARAEDVLVADSRDQARRKGCSVHGFCTRGLIAAGSAESPAVSPHANA
jgi:hypothetical protein